ncbi:MAG: DNA cytosine methyltransferase [Bacteroidales bacterium]
MTKDNNINTVEEPQLVFKYESKKTSSNSKETFRMLSLFSGCGGMDLGFEGGFSVLKESVNELMHPDFIDKIIDDHYVLLKKTRFKTVFANDILIPARNAWINYFSKRGHSIEDYETESIVDLVKLHNNGTEVFPTNIDIVTGGFPCQDFSIAGKRNGFKSHRNHKGELLTETCATEETRGKLYMWMKEVIEITKPKVFIAENVKGLVNLSNVKDIIQKDFENTGNGYIVLPPQVLHAADYGVPQSRERVFFIGLLKSALNKTAINELSKDIISNEYSPYPLPTHNFNKKNKKLKDFVTLEKVFKTLQEPKKSNDLSQQSFSRAKYMGKHCQGQIEIKLNGISPTIRAEHHGNIEYRRLSKANGGILKNELSRGLEERRLTVRECALIQTFPPDYEFVIPSKSGRRNSYLVSPSKAYKIIGNAVPPLLAYNLAKRIEQNWNLYFE